MKSKPLRVLCFPKQGENPYLNQLSSRLEAAGLEVDEFSFPRAFRERYDVVHLHWPDTHLWSESWWRSLGKHVRLGALCLWLRLRRTRIVWTLHNLHTHEKDHWIGATLFPLWFPRAVTDVIALSPSGLAMMQRRYRALRRARAAVIPHGHYRETFPPPAERAAARRALGLDPRRRTILFFGSIRRYKNVPLLIDVFRRLQGDDVQLVVAGNPVVNMRSGEVAAAAQGDPRVYLFLRHIAESEIPLFYGAADLVVTPFAEVLNSGSVMLALSQNRPVLAPRLGALPDLARLVGTRWLRLYDGELEPALLDQAGREALTVEPDETVDLSAFDWPGISAATIAHYRRETIGDRRVDRETEAVPATSTAAGS